MAVDVLTLVGLLVELYGIMLRLVVSRRSRFYAEQCGLSGP